MNAWQYASAPDLADSLSERLSRFPRRPDMLVYGLRLGASVVLRSWLRLYHRLSVVGREHLPTDRSFVMVANHTSHLDALCLLAALPMSKVHKAFPAAARDYFFVNPRRAAATVVVVNAMPFDRTDSPRHSLDACRQLLEEPGNVLIYFPEGTRSTSGELGEFKAGIGMLVAGTNCPVVPCHLDGTFAAWQKNRWLPRPWKIQVRIGTPCCFAEREPGKAAAVAIGKELQDAVRNLASAMEPGAALGEELVCERTA